MHLALKARSGCALLVWLSFGRISAGQQPAGTIYYNAYDFSSGQPVLTLDTIKPDGTAPSLLPVPLPEPAYPAVSRDGRLVAVTSADPQKRFTLSRDVFVENLVTTQLLQLTSFPNTWLNAQTNYTTGAVTSITFDAAKYTLPLFKAFSPDGSHLVVADYEINGSLITYSLTNSFGSDLYTGTTTTPTARVYAFDGSPSVLVAAGTGADIHGGDGIDWSPDGTLLAWPNAIDVLFAGTGQPGRVTAIFLMSPVADAIAAGQARQVTFPQGETGIVAQGAYVLWETDYQPAFSPDGKRLAYIHAVSESVAGLPGYDSQPALHILDVNGTNDLEILRFNVGEYVTHVSWSPDGTRLVFDLGPQAIGPDGFPYLLAAANSDALYTVSTNGLGFTHLLNAASTWPVWAVAPVPPATPPTLAFGSPRNTRRMSLFWPQGSNFILQTSPQLGPGANWQRVNVQTVTNGGVQSVTVDSSSGSRFYRLSSP